MPGISASKVDAPLSRPVPGSGSGLVQLILLWAHWPQTNSLTPWELGTNQPTKKEAAFSVPSAQPQHLAKDCQSITSTMSSGVKLGGQPRHKGRKPGSSSF